MSVNLSSSGNRMDSPTSGGCMQSNLSNSKYNGETVISNQQQSDGCKSVSNELVFCFDYQQNRGCVWPFCKYIHCRAEEESLYRQFGTLTDSIRLQVEQGIGLAQPVCKDFLNNCCNRAKCKFRHHQRPLTLLGRHEGNAVDDVEALRRELDAVNKEVSDLRLTNDILVQANADLRLRLAAQAAQAAQAVQTAQAVQAVQAVQTAQAVQAVQASSMSMSGRFNERTSLPFSFYGGCDGSRFLLASVDRQRMMDESYGNANSHNGTILSYAIAPSSHLIGRHLMNASQETSFGQRKCPLVSSDDTPTAFIPITVRFPPVAGGPIPLPPTACYSIASAAVALTSNPVVGGSIVSGSMNRYHQGSSNLGMVQAIPSMLAAVTTATTRMDTASTAGWTGSSPIDPFVSPSSLFVAVNK